MIANNLFYCFSQNTNIFILLFMKWNGLLCKLQKYKCENIGCFDEDKIDYVVKVWQKEVEFSGIETTVNDGKIFAKFWKILHSHKTGIFLKLDFQILTRLKMIKTQINRSILEEDLSYCQNIGERIQITCFKLRYVSLFFIILNSN